MKFSERIGKAPPTKFAQIESIDSDLKNSLWSSLSIFYWDHFDSRSSDMMDGRSDFIKGSNFEILFFRLWLHFFKKPTDTIPQYWEEGYQFLRNFYFKAVWYEIYDLLEFIPINAELNNEKKFYEFANKFLERENSGYRFVNGIISEISNEDEINEVERAVQSLDSYSGAREHLRTAIILMSDRKNPDFRNSIKESVSAIESLAKIISKENSATLGEILKALEKAKKLHPALKSAYSSLYGYSSDGDGIRHALLDESTLNKSDARFMLISCSAFINYVIDNIS